MTTKLNNLLLLISATALWMSNPTFADHFYGTKETLSLTTESELRFIAMGDWGDDNRNQYKVADAMGEWCENNLCEFIFSLGDNFYYRGVWAADDERFKTTWSDVYSHPSIANLTWNVIAGNHDHGEYALLEDGHEWFQVEHSKLDPRWNFPDLAYSLTVDIKDSKIKFVAIDTESIRHNVNNPDEMLDFFEDELNDPDPDWKIALGHHPAFTATGGFISGGPIRDNVLPIMERYDTDIYLSGHEHNQQHFQPIGHPELIDHVITGGGGYLLGPYSAYEEHQSNKAGGELIFYDINYGFTYFIIDSNSITWQFINYDGEVVYEYTRSK